MYCVCVCVCVYVYVFVCVCVCVCTIPWADVVAAEPRETPTTATHEAWLSTRCFISSISAGLVCSTAGSSGTSGGIVACVSTGSDSRISDAPCWAKISSNFCSIASCFASCLFSLSLTCAGVRARARNHLRVRTLYETLCFCLDCRHPGWQVAEVAAQTKLPTNAEDFTRVN